MGWEHPVIIQNIVASAVGGYFSVSFVLLLIKHFGPTYAECVKGSRKVLSIVLSYLLFPSPDKGFNVKHSMGVGLFVISIGVTIYSKASKGKKHKGYSAV